MTNDNTVPKPCSRFMPPAWYFAALVTMLVLHYGLPWRPILSWPWTLCGILPIVIGVTIALLGNWQFRQRQTTVKPYEASALLVQDGIFRWTRNPMYLGLTMILLGAAISLGSATPFLVAAVFPLWLQHCFIRAEERALTSRFGQQYESYLRQTRRWI